MWVCLWIMIYFFVSDVVGDSVVGSLKTVSRARREGGSCGSHAPNHTSSEAPRHFLCFVFGFFFA